MNRNPSPREQFIKDSKAVAEFNELMDSQVLCNALDAALLEYQRRLSKATIADLGGCASTHFRAVGAQEYLDLLRNFCESQVIPAPAGQPNLNTNQPRKN